MASIAAVCVRPQVSNEGASFSTLCTLFETMGFFSPRKSKQSNGYRQKSFASTAQSLFIFQYGTLIDIKAKLEINSRKKNSVLWNPPRRTSLLLSLCGDRTGGNYKPAWTLNRLQGNSGHPAQRTAPANQERPIWWAIPPVFSWLHL